MAQITLKANINECTVEGWQSNTGEVNARVMSVEMSEDLLTCDKQFVTFELADGTVYESLVVDGKAKIPIFEKPQFIKIGMYAENISGDECEKRYSAHPANQYVTVGSFKDKADEQPKPTPGDYAELLERIEDIENTGGGGDGCGITVVYELDVEKEYGAKEVPSMNNFATNMSVLSEISASLKDVQKLKQKDIELSNRIDQHYLDTTAHIGNVVDAVNQKQKKLVDTAEVGQTVRVLHVGDNGEPMDWEAVDFPTGGGAEEWVEILNTTLADDVAYVDMVAPDGKVFKKLHIHIATNSAGLSTQSKISVLGTRLDYILANVHTLASTNGNVNTWNYPTFIIEKGELFSIGLACNGGGNNSMTPVYIGGVGTLTSYESVRANNGDWKLIRIQPQTADVVFKAGVTFYVWGVYEDA